MSLLLQGGRWSLAVAALALSCTTYDELSPADAASGAASGGSGGAGPGEAGKTGASASKGGGSGAGPLTAGTESGGSTAAGGAPDQNEGGAPACLAGDCCPDDDAKTAPGSCGCGAPDVDSDADGSLDCDDACPEDAEKLAPGGCGCGLPEEESAELALCSSLKDVLIHRYDFEGGGTMVQDRIGTAHGTIEGLAEQSELAGKGVLSLVGNGAYVNLPNGLISGLTSVSMEAWITWNGGKAWQRVLDFGESDVMPPEDAQGSGKDYLFLTPMASGSGSRFGFSLNGANNETAVSLPTALGTGLSHLVAVVDTAQDKMIYYVNGAKVGEAAFPAALSAINDVNVWLGRSQYSNDPAFTGTYHDFRVYEVALTAQQVATSFIAGPDPGFLASQ